MPGPYRLYGADLSPYSVKVRNYLRFKGIEHTWIPRSAARQAEFARFARLPLIPVLVGSDDFVLQDSTPIIERLEGHNPEPTIIPDDPTLAFLSALLEDYADEWVNKAMFHYRWTYPADQESAAGRIAAMMFDGGAVPEGAAETIRERMVGRLPMVGSSGQTGGVIERSFERLLGFLETHLNGRAYLFGGRPALADFGLGAQLAQLESDPTPGAIIAARAPAVSAWLARLDRAAVEGAFEPIDALIGTLKPLLTAEVGALYLKWSAANFVAVKTELDLDVEIDGVAFQQKPQKYAAKALTDLRRKRLLQNENAGLIALLIETGCEPAVAPLDRGRRDADANGEADAADREPDDQGADG